MEWERYQCDEPPPEKGFSLSDAIQLREVFHVVHLNASYRILEDKMLRSGLVFDKSVLNTERILVNWLSPNYWYYGSRYGNVIFSFDFQELVRGKNIYWVEVIEYGIHAPRFLITENNYKGHKHLIPYNPKRDKGPWIERDGEYWWKNNVTLEFMFEKDLLTREIKEIDFTAHHKYMCKIDPKSCRDRGLDAVEARGRFISTVLGKAIPVKLFHFVEKDEDGTRIVRSNLKDGLRGIFAEARNYEFKGEITFKSGTAHSLALAALTYLGENELELFEDVLSLFKSFEDFRQTVRLYVVRRFKLADDSSLKGRFI